MSELISKDKEYTLRSGEAVRIYATDGGGHFPVHGAYLAENGARWVLARWTTEGDYYADASSSLDLIPKPKTISFTRWANVYTRPLEGHEFVLYGTRSMADQSPRAPSRVACLEVQIKGIEGDGLK